VGYQNGSSAKHHPLNLFIFSENHLAPKLPKICMILLVTPSERAPECAAALHTATGKPVLTASTLAQATTLLRAQCYLVAVLDQHLLEAQPDEARTILDHLDTAIPVQINLAISGMERLVREVGAAVQRRQREEVQARHAAMGKLQSALNGTMTALLLSVELTRVIPDLPSAAEEKLQSVHELVKGLRRQLETVSEEKI
jgi:hypothetical protein